jgi:hypothetical protein
LGIKDLFPGKAAAGTCAHPAHYCHQGTLGHVVTIIDYLSGAQRSKECILFELMTVDPSVSCSLPGIFACNRACLQSGMSL